MIGLDKYSVLFIKTRKLHEPEFYNYIFEKIKSKKLKKWFTVIPIDVKEEEIKRVLDVLKNLDRAWLKIRPEEKIIDGKYVADSNDVYIEIVIHLPLLNNYYVRDITSILCTSNLDEKLEELKLVNEFSKATKYSSIYKRFKKFEERIKESEKKYRELGNVRIEPEGATFIEMHFRGAGFKNLAEKKYKLKPIRNVKLEYVDSDRKTIEPEILNSGYDERITYRVYLENKDDIGILEEYGFSYNINGEGGDFDNYYIIIPKDIFILRQALQRLNLYGDILF